jgi:dTDP-4-dehydrorhamnose reductase
VTRFLVVGARGLVGTELCGLLSARGDAVLQGDLPECDVTDPEGFAAWAGDAAPDWVVNLAAFTRVDDCEQDPRTAFRVNGFGPGVVGQWARRRGAMVVQVSTDYVFDGAKGSPYEWRDPPNPLSIYGMSKLMGEYALEAAVAGDRLLVVRGQSLYGGGGKSFPDAILEAARTRREIPVVTDQRVSPTWARDFAGGLLRLVDMREYGVFHLSASGDCTWNEFAKAVLEEAGVSEARITETTSEALGRPARRPASSVFDLRDYEQVTGTSPRPWREQLRDYLRSTGRAA